MNFVAKVAGYYFKAGGENMGEQEENKTATMPFYVHEIEMTRAETTIKRLTWLCFAGWIVTALSIIAAIIR